MRAQFLDFTFEVVGGAERPVHGRKSEVGHFVEVTQRTQDRQTHFVTRNFGRAGCAHGIFDFLSEEVESVVVDLPTLAGTAHATLDLLPAERLGDSAALDDRQHRGFDRAEPATALGAGPAPTNCLPVVHLARIDHARIRVSAVRAMHRLSFVEAVVAATPGSVRERTGED